MMDGSANGDPPKRYTATATDGFDRCWSEIVRAYPRVVDAGLRKQIEAYLRVTMFNQSARNISGKMWQLVTQEGFGVPEIYVFFRFVNQHITLEFAGVTDD